VERSQPADPRDSAFAAQQPLAVPTFPRDYVLGQLAQTLTDPVAVEAREYARSFLLSLGTDSPPVVDGLAPGARMAVTELAESLSEDASLRIGTIVQLSDGEYSVEFRYLQASDPVVGELIVAFEEGDWYTSDIQTSRQRDSDQSDDQLYEPGITARGNR